MCGITGFLERDQTSDAWNGKLEKMAGAIAYRGPDDQGVWFDPRDGVGFAHRRLSIIDVSAQGHQPMASPSGRYVICYNGEVYNFEAMRAELGGHGISWRGHSDTEVILAAFEAWGVEKTIGKFIGMFAFALWDNLEKTLFLARDRLGIKPLFYGWAEDAFLFGSELKALLQHPKFSREVNADTVPQLLQFGCIPNKLSIFKGINKLEPGQLLKLNWAEQKKGPVYVQDYWSVLEVAKAGQQNLFTGSDAEMTDELESLLLDAVRLRMVSDVPVGAFLSGGIDSSTVVALMQAQRNDPVKTFSIGFEEDAFNEAHHAKQVAEHLNTNHTELYLTNQDALDLVPRLTEIYDEPFCDPSQIPTYLVSRLARESVIVSLSGDGGDELFAGYERHFKFSKLWSSLSRVPGGCRHLGAGLIQALPDRFWDVSLGWLIPHLSKSHHGVPASEFLNRAAEYLSCHTIKDVYDTSSISWGGPFSILAPDTRNEIFDCRKSGFDQVENEIAQLMYLDTVSYLPDLILTKVDRASMAWGLEARVPLLDHRVVEFAWRLPMRRKAGENSKQILREVLYKYVPPHLIDRPKTGFGAPLESWLLGPLRDWAEDLLSAEKLRDAGIFDPDRTRAKWQSFLSGRTSENAFLWNVLVFQDWHGRWVSR
ncbi:MAG: asparagine synthase (glutamine-hydrolyzing) [Pseudomonadota bacterium]